MQNASDILMSAVNPRGEDIRLAKQYKERIHRDVGGTWVMKACKRTVSDKGKTAPRIENPPMGLETRTEKETSSPRTEQLQIGHSKVHIGGKIPLEEAL